VTAASAARAILRQLNEIMASAASPQAKLDRVVRLIAVGLDSEVCSIYLLRDGVLELFATRGLAQEAVHVTRLGFGEGLVGTIAQTREVLNLAEAWSHPNFVYRPETGEELFHSFAGVPIIRAEQAIGVLCVQHLEPRSYADVEIEALQTVAMVVSELIASAGLADDLSIRARASAAGPLRLSGLKLVDGLALGRAVFHQPRVFVEHTVADDVEVERKRVLRAFAVMREQIDQMMRQAEFAVPGDHDEILETYKMFAYDEGWARRINEAIDSGLTAEAAIERVQQRTRERMRSIQDPFFRERLHDLDDLSNRLMRIVSGKLGTAAECGLDVDTILLARNLGPAELLEYDRRWLKGVVLEEGSLTAHVTIVARAMGVAVLGRVPNLRANVADGDPLLLDCVNSALVVRPTSAMVKQYEAMSALKARRDAQYAKLRDLPAVSRDGERITIYINAGLREDVDGLALTNADGIGLFRTEFQFLVSATLPRREAQTHLYRAVLENAGDKPVTFRSVDIGGDKAVPYVREMTQEENPVLGWRALRLALERKGLLKVQARALLDAAAGRVLNVMFPMVTEPWEFDRAKEIVEEEADWLRRKGRPLPEAICYGAMLEVPAVAEVLDLLLPKVDFLSIGTNDLLQFLFAADRSNPKLADRYDWLSPAVLRFLKRIVDTAAHASVPLTVCGEMGGRPTESLALLALGIRRLSITPAAVGPIKAMIRSADLGALRTQMAQWLGEPRADIRGLLTEAADAQGIVRD
jgi:phosphotransferase system enzyme I (PtsP)